METLARRVRGRSFIWLLLLVVGVTALLFELLPSTSAVRVINVIGFWSFATLFAAQAVTGIALDNAWVACIDRSVRPFSYWWRVAACGMGAAAFAYVAFVRTTG